MRKAIVLLMVLATAGTAFAQDLGNSKERPVKNTPTRPYTPPAEIKQGGDTIFDATVIPGLPFTDTGNTCGYIDDYDEICPYSGSTAPDVVYSFTPVSDMSIDVDLCGSMYDTKLFIYDSGLNLVACNDDFYFEDPCGIYVSRIEGAPLVGGKPTSSSSTVTIPTAEITSSPSPAAPRRAICPATVMMPCPKVNPHWVRVTLTPGTAAAIVILLSFRTSTLAPWTAWPRSAE